MLPAVVKRLRERHLTLFGQAILLISGEILANAVCWIAAALTLGQADGLLGLALLAWVSSLYACKSGEKLTH
jgi:high-affinity nickel-transport protein